MATCSLTSPPLRRPPGLQVLLVLSTAFTGAEAAGISSTTTWILISVLGSVALTVILNLICCYCRRRGMDCGICYCGDPPEEKEKPAHHPPSAGQPTPSAPSKVTIVNADGSIMREGDPGPIMQDGHEYERLGRTANAGNQ